MKSDNIIEVRDITKCFKVFVDKGNTVKERALFSKRRKYDYKQVLRGINFDVKKGEAIGLIGHNGCGKSTTLKLLTKIIYPDSGNIKITGRVSSLIELGAGFHPDMSGRENIYINASIFGLGRKEIDNKLDDIIAFSELEESINHPVRTYSSGMYMRLAFSVAINVNADVLLIDEILGVGDANFQAKCFNKLREIKAKGTTIVIVSHSLGQIEQICERSIWIHEGVIRVEGTPREVHPVYLDYMGQKREEIAEKEAVRQAEKEVVLPVGNEIIEISKIENVSLDGDKSENAQINTDEIKEDQNKKRWGNGHIRFVDVCILDKEGKKRNVFKTGSDIMIQLSYKVNKVVENDVAMGIGIFRSDGMHCYGTNTLIDKIPDFRLNEDGMVVIKLKNVMLMSGVYVLDVAIEADMSIPIDFYREAAVIEMYSEINDVGLCRIEHEWQYEKN